VRLIRSQFVLERGQVPKVELRRMANRPNRCSPRSGSLIPSASLILHRMGLFSRSMFYVINTEVEDGRAE
jgi:hypothetical protein